MRLPPELWEVILVQSGPLACCPLVGASVRTVAARRIQRAARATFVVDQRRLPPGAFVRVQHIGACAYRDEWRTGVVCSGTPLVVKVCNRKHTYVFLPNPFVRLRRLEWLEERIVRGLAAGAGHGERGGDERGHEKDHAGVTGAIRLDEDDGRAVPLEAGA